MKIYEELRREKSSMMSLTGWQPTQKMPTPFIFANCGVYRRVRQYPQEYVGGDCFQGSDGATNQFYVELRESG